LPFARVLFSKIGFTLRNIFPQNKRKFHFSIESRQKMCYNRKDVNFPPQKRLSSEEDLKTTLKLRSGAVISAIEPSTAKKKNYLSRMNSINSI